MAAAHQARGGHRSKPWVVVRGGAHTSISRFGGCDEAQSSQKLAILQRVIQMSEPPRWQRALAAQPVQWLSDRVARTSSRSAGRLRAVVEAQALPPAPGAGVADDDLGLRMLHRAVTQQPRQQRVQVVRPRKAGYDKRDASPHARQRALLQIPVARVRTRFTHASAQFHAVACLVGPVAGQHGVHAHAQLQRVRVVLWAALTITGPARFSLLVRQARCSARKVVRFRGAPGPKPSAEGTHAGRSYPRDTSERARARRDGARGETSQRNQRPSISCCAAAARAAAATSRRCSHSCRSAAARRARGACG